jgi:hypothetical protein
LSFKIANTGCERLRLRVVLVRLALFGEARQAHTVDDSDDADERQPDGHCDLQPGRPWSTIGW